MPSFRFRRQLELLSIVLAILLGGSVACDSSGSIVTASGEEEIPGEYEATTFTVTQGATTMDVLSAGGELRLVLNREGSATGRLFIPGGAGGGSDTDESLSGTWTFDESEGTVRLELTSEVFLDDLALAASVRSGNRLELSAEETVTDVTIGVVLVQRS